jgi:hypothetical protein
VSGKGLSLQHLEVNGLCPSSILCPGQYDKDVVVRDATQVFANGIAVVRALDS